MRDMLRQQHVYWLTTFRLHAKVPLSSGLQAGGCWHTDNPQVACPTVVLSSDLQASGC